MPEGLRDFDRKLQAVIDDYNSITTKCDEKLGSIEEAYDKDGANKLSEEGLRQAVLDGNVPTAITNTGSSSSCGKPCVSDCGKYTLDSDP